MCYAIPGNVKNIAGNLITVDYFGEERKARNDFYDLQVGDYVYAQGGYVVQKIEENLLKKSWIHGRKCSAEEDRKKRDYCQDT